MQSQSFNSIFGNIFGKKKEEQKKETTTSTETA
jgi:hypothetical protein